MAVWVFAVGLIGGFSVNAMANYKDVRVNPEHKHQVIRDWGLQRTKTITEAVGTVRSEMSSAKPHGSTFVVSDFELFSHALFPFPSFPDGLQHPIGMNARRYKTVYKGEGLGIDHDEWVASKKKQQQ